MISFHLVPPNIVQFQGAGNQPLWPTLSVPSALLDDLLTDRFESLMGVVTVFAWGVTSYPPRTLWGYRERPRWVREIAHRCGLRGFGQ